MITFNFGCFLEHFFDFCRLVIFSPEPFVGVSTWLVTLRGCLIGTICIASKSLLIHFSWNPKLFRNERKSIHIFVPSHMSPFQWPLMPVGGILWRSKLGPRKSESVYYNIQFWLFLDKFLTFADLVIFSPETFVGVPTWLVTLRRCLAQFVLPWKAFEHPICSFLLKLKLPRNERKDINIFVPSQIQMSPFQWPPCP